MKISMYQASVPVFIRVLTNLATILDKAEAHAETHKIHPAVLVQARLFPNMYPLSRQVQIASDMVKGGASRLAGLAPPQYEDNEASFAELKGRIDKTITYLKTFTPEQIDGSEERKVTLSVGGQEMTFEGMPYLLHFVLPNLYFHVTTAYAILRHWGVELGKSDFRGKL